MGEGGGRKNEFFTEQKREITKTRAKRRVGSCPTKGRPKIELLAGE